jgi:hypothetical protein
MATLISPAAKEADRLTKISLILRDYLRDSEETNYLLEGEEYSDNQLRTYTLLALDYYNSSITPISIRADVMTFPSLSLWLDGSAMFALKSSIFRYCRNAFTYNDSGVQVSVEEKAAEYERTVQRLIQEFDSKARAIKEHINLEGCYGGFSSEYLNLFIVGRHNIATKV